MPPRWKRPRLPRLPRSSRSNGPGLLFILVALVAVAVAGARLLGFTPDIGLDSLTIETQVPPVIEVGQPDTTPESESTPDETVPQQPTASIMVYHAHATENYGPGETHTQGGRPGHVVEVGRTLTSWLQDEGLQAVQNTAVHDHPSWNDAFPNAARVVAALMHDQQNVAAVLDVHRDAIEADVGKDALTVQIGDRSVARIMLVVGEQNNPYAQDNATFAEALTAKMNELYPGLSRGIRIQRSDYNGRLHPNATQVFIGDYRYNTVEEANEAARLFAHVVAETLR